MSKILQVGDIIEITEGMKIYAQIEERFVYSNKRTSKELTQTDIKVGEVRDDTHENEFKTKKFAGKYVVTDTSLSGGGGAPHDSYPDGWHVIAQKLSKDGHHTGKGVVINFYQTGCFTAMIKPEEIAPVGTMVKKVTFE